MANATVKEINVGQVKKDWDSRGFSCEVWTDPPGQIWEDYVHDVDELLMVIEGKLRFELNGKSQELLPGKEVFIPARALHSVENIGGATARWFYGYKRK